MSRPENPAGLRGFLEGCFYQDTGGTPAARRQTRRFTLWQLAWAISYVGAAYLLKHSEGLALWLVVLLIGLPVALGLVVLGSYVQLLRITDEMIRKIHLEALAVGFGVFTLLGLSHILVEAAGGPRLEMALLVVAGIFSWSIAVVVGQGRHR